MSRTLTPLLALACISFSSTQARTVTSARPSAACSGVLSMLPLLQGRRFHALHVTKKQKQNLKKKNPTPPSHPLAFRPINQETKTKTTISRPFRLVRAKRFYPHVPFGLSRMKPFFFFFTNQSTRASGKQQGGRTQRGIDRLIDWLIE